MFLPLRERGFDAGRFPACAEAAKLSQDDMPPRRVASKIPPNTMQTTTIPAAMSP